MSYLIFGEDDAATADDEDRLRRERSGVWLVCERKENKGSLWGRMVWSEMRKDGMGSVSRVVVGDSKLGRRKVSSDCCVFLWGSLVCFAKAREEGGDFFW